MFWYIAITCILLVVGYLFLVLFQPSLKYRIATQPAAIDSKGFLRVLEALTDAKVRSATSIDVLPNGENFYPAELEAIKNAQHTINLEAYIFKRGRLTEQVIPALVERARAGVKVNVLLDAVGSMALDKDTFRDLIAAGGKMQWYHPLRWYSWDRFNNRTHREMLIVDGETAFVGGAGYADQWMYPQGKEERWRDTMFRIRGEAVTGLQGTFIENWLQADNELLEGEAYFPMPKTEGTGSVLVVNSEPSVGGSTRARILVQTLLAAATKSILITTPYFLPDRSLRNELVRAIKERGVQVSILVPGTHSDHALTRSSSRRLFGDLLQAGASIYEYNPTMIHAKVLVVDGIWSVFGSTNFDSRSFGLNDEVNVAVENAALATQLTQQFKSDLQQSTRVGYEQWKHRALFEKGEEYLGMIIQRQE